MKKLSGMLILAIIFILAACTAVGTPSSTATPEATQETVSGRAIVLGDISDDPTEVINGAQPFADYLAAKLADAGISEGQVKVATSSGEMANMLAEGEVDLYFDSMYPATIVSDMSGAQPLLRRWRSGVGEYYTVIFARKDSGITTLDDLAGKKVAMDNPYSTSGYALPSVYLIEAGLDLTLIDAPEDPIEATQTGYVFTYDDVNTVQWVLSGLVDAGVTDNRSYESFPQDALDQFTIITETEKVPRQVVLASPKIAPDLLEKIKAVLLAAGDDPDAQEALDTFAHTTKFDEFPTGIEESSNRMREILSIIQNLEAKQE